ncbi:MAG TPA: hypothetical protein VGO55_01795 [Allosphingosinicella sp.]|nr:hypothetical protein [Allosphingosinicella sp.]
MGFDSETGAIVTSDGDRFGFEIRNWRDECPPARGLAVDFVPRDGTADEIYLALEPEGAARVPSGEVPSSPTPETAMSAPAAEFDAWSSDDEMAARPGSIGLFEQLAFGSLAIDTYMLLRFAGEGSAVPGLQASSFETTVVLLGLAFNAFLAGVIHFAARRRSNVARWIYVAVFALSVILILLAAIAPPDSLLYVPPDGPGLIQWTGWLSMLLTIGSICCLFTRESGHWFDPNRQFLDE